MSITLLFKQNPKAVQSFRFANRGGKYAVKYQPKEVVDWKKSITTQAKMQLNSDFKAFSGAVCVHADFSFVIPKTYEKKHKAMWNAVHQGFLVRKITKPDLTDNLMKGLMDALAGTVFERDQLISDTGSTRKFYSLQAYTKLIFYEVPIITDEINEFYTGQPIKQSKFTLNFG